MPKFLCFLIFGIVTFPSVVFAQVRGDQTLGTENSIVTPNIEINGIPSDRIDGGAVRGRNLFHSFSDLNVVEGQGVYFSNPEGIANIISRVTGNNPSSILGKLGVLGDANLFLLNPNGIVFGPHASLDLKGSFVATTANAIEFDGQGVFSASEPNIPPLLTVNPSAFIFNRLRPGSIALNSSREPAGQRKFFNYYSNMVETKDAFGLKVPDGKSLILLGGDLALNDSELNALEGRIELGSVAGTGKVNLSIHDNIFSLNFPDSLALANVSITQGNQIYTDGDRGGDIQITGNNISITGGSSLAAETFGDQSGGDVVLIAKENLEIIDTTASGLGPNISTITRGNGASGNIIIDTKKLILKNGPQISTASIGKGNGGELNVNASESIELTGTGPDTSFSGMTNYAAAEGKGGNININTKDLILREGGLITTQSYFPATGAGGNININASHSVSLFDAFYYDGQVFGGIVSGSDGEGNAGNININTGNLTIQHGGPITSASVRDGTGIAGDITINASQTVNLSGKESVLEATGTSLGKAGNLTIKTGQMNVTNGAQVTVNNPEGQAGNLTIEANNLFLDRGFLTAETAETGVNGANINLSLSNLLKMQNESLISAQATGGANGGNVTINSALLAVLLPTGPNGSDIIAKAEAGNGGNILINSQGIFGTAEEKAIAGNRTNDIDASSEYGAPGRVLINNTIDPNQGTVTLPENVVDPNTLVAQNACKRGTASQLTQTGRGGLPPTISENLNSQAIAVGLVDPAPSSVSQAENQAIASQNSPIVQNQIAPAQGWIFNQKGEVMLVAYDPTVTGSQRVKVNSLGCVMP